MDKSRQQYGRYGNQSQRNRMNNRFSNQSNSGERREERADFGCEKNMCNDCAEGINNEYRVGQGPFGGPGPVGENNTCCPGSGRDELAGMPLAMAYVPWQFYCNLYDDCEALYHGTLFKDLDKGFYGRRCE